MSRAVAVTGGGSSRLAWVVLVICTCLMIGCGGSAPDKESNDPQADSKDQSKPTAQAESESSGQESMESIFERAQAAAEAYKKTHPHPLTQSDESTETNQLADAGSPQVPGSQPDAAPQGPVSLEGDVGLDVTLPAGSVRRSTNRSAGFAMGNYSVPRHSATEMMAFFDKELGRLGFTQNEKVPNFGSVMGSGTESANRNYESDTQDVMVTAMGDPDEGVMLGVFVSDKK